MAFRFWYLMEGLGFYGYIIFYVISVFAFAILSALSLIAAIGAAYDGDDEAKTGFLSFAFCLFIAFCAYIILPPPSCLDVGWGKPPVVKAEKE